MDVIRTIDRSLLILDSIATSGKRFGMGHNPHISTMDPIKKRLSDRRAALSETADEQALAWGAQAEAQESVLTDISFAFDNHVSRINTLTAKVEDAAAALGGFNLPDDTRMKMLEVAMAFADAALASDLPATARTMLAEAQNRAGSLPVEFLEDAILAIERTADDARSSKAGLGRWVSYDVGGINARERQYKLELAKIRVLIRTDPEAATKELGEVQKLIVDLQTEAELVGNMDAIDAAWKALDDAYSIWFSSFGTALNLRTLKDEGDDYHEKWLAIHKNWKYGAADEKAQAKKDLDALRADPGLPEYFGNVKDAVKDAQTEALIGKLAAMLVITVVTMGVGDLVAAGAVGWELTAGETAFVVGGAEAATFTLLSQIFLDDNHSFGHIVGDFASNWAMFGAMRYFQAFAEVAKLGTVAKVGGGLVLQTAMTVAKAEIDKYIADGRTLNKAEIKTMAVQGVVMAIAMHAVAPLAKPMFAELEGEAYAFASRLKANNKTRSALAGQAEALKGTKALGQAQKYVASEKAWLEDRIQLLEEVEAQMAKEEADTSSKKGGGIAGKIELSPAQLASLKADLKANLATVSAAEQPLLYLEPKAPGVFSCPREHAADVVKTLGETTSVTEDPTTRVKTYEVKTPDGQKITVIESVDPKTQWVDTLRASLNEASRARFDEVVKGLSPEEVYELFEGDVAHARAVAEGFDLPDDLLATRNGLSDAARGHFDSLLRSSLRDPEKPTAGELQSFRQKLAAIRQKSGGDLEKGLGGDASAPPPAPQPDPDQPPPAPDDAQPDQPAPDSKPPAPPQGPAPDAKNAAKLQEIRDKLAVNSAKLRDLYAKRSAARQRGYDAAAQVVHAEGRAKEELRARRDRNFESAERWKKEIDDLETENQSLRDRERELEPPPPQPQTWQEAEDALRKEFGGRMREFPLLGENRRVDCYTDDGVAREAKFGPQGLSDFIEAEIAKDVELRDSGAIEDIEWHFYLNAKGEGGPYGPLRDALTSNNIRIVKHY
jgi:hypothetical protein